MGVRFNSCSVPAETGQCLLMLSSDTDGGDFLHSGEEGSFTLSTLYQVGRMAVQMPSPGSGERQRSGTYGVKSSSP